MTLNMAIAASYASGQQALQLAINGDGSIQEIALLLAKEKEESSSSNGFDDKHTAIEVAACLGHISALERLLEAGADSNASVLSYPHNSVLEVAASHGQLFAVQKLIEKGAHPDYCDPNSESYTPLMAAADAGHIEICKALLRAGADVSIVKKFGKKSAIQSAAEISSITLLEVFLKPVIDTAAAFNPDDAQVAISECRQNDIIRMSVKTGFLKRARQCIDAALVAAGGTGHIPILQRLLDAGADIKAHKHAAIAAAAAKGHLEAMNMLLQIASSHDTVPVDSITQALQSAVDGGHVALIGPLLQAGADAKQIDIREASINGHLKVLISILQAGAKAESSHSRHGRGTALQFAAKHGHLPVVEFLLASGADINASSVWGTAIHLAVAGRHLKVAKQLIDAGADVNELPGQGSDTPLQAAVRTGDMDVLELLLAAGAAVDAAEIRPYGWSNTALSIAAETNNSQLVAKFLSMLSPSDARQTASAALQKAVQNHHAAVVRQLLQVHLDVNIHVPHRVTLLQESAANGDDEILELLLAEKADVNLNPTNGRWNTALQFASEQGSLNAVKLLLAAGAEVNVTESSTAPPLLLAARHGHIQVFEHLLIAGADVHAKTYRCETLQQVAEESEDAEMVKRVQAVLESRPRAPSQTEQSLGRGTGRLCKTCYEASLTKLFQNEKHSKITLHPSLVALKTSARTGCPFCCFVWRALGITSISLPQPSPVRFWNSPGQDTIGIQVDEAFPKDVEKPESLNAHFCYAIEPFGGERT